MAKYIENKRINVNKSNEVLEFRDISKAVWKFLSTIYNSEWDLLIANKNNNSFKQKIVFKFTFKVNLIKTRKKEKKNMDKPVSFERLSLLILAKLPKEVKGISKFFKTINSAYRNKDTRKLYAQVLQLANNTRKVLKIKKAFLNLQANKIENIQKIIKDDSKPKSKINMTTKGPSRKHIIVPMNNDNKMKFIQDSSNHIANINRMLKNIKLEVIANFIHFDQSGITIVTNKVALLLDLQMIENCVKSANYIEVECYDLKLKVLSNKTTLVLSNIRELDRDPFTK